MATSTKENTMRPRFRDFPWKKKFQIVKGTFSRFTLDMGLFHGAALSFYLIFTMIPLLYLAINVIGSIVGREMVTNMINVYLKEYFGIDDFSGILSFLETIQFGGGYDFLKFIVIIVLIISSSAIFIALKTSINYFYGIIPHFESGKKKFFVNLIHRLISIGLLSGFGILMITGYFAQLVFNSLGKHLFQDYTILSKFWLELSRHGISIFFSVLFLTFVYRHLNDAVVRRKVAIVGACVATILLEVGEFVIQKYMDFAYFAKSGSVISVILILLAFVYYGSQAIFLGASVSAAYGEMTDQPIVSKYRKR